jgi:hypothetical protein
MSRLTYTIRLLRHEAILSGAAVRNAIVDGKRRRNGLLMDAEAMPVCVTLLGDDVPRENCSHSTASDGWLPQ